MVATDFVRRKTKSLLSRLSSDIEQGIVPSDGIVGLHALLCTSQRDAVSIALAKSSGVDIIARALRKYPSDRIMQISGIAVLYFVLFHAERTTVSKCPRIGAANLFVNALRQFPDDEQTCDLGMKAVQTMVLQFGLKGASVDTDIIRFIFEAVEHNQNNITVINNACLLISYSFTEANKDDQSKEETQDMFANAGCIPIITKGLNLACKSSVLKSEPSLSSLMLLAHGSFTNSATIVSAGGVELCITAMKRWDNSAMMQWQACTLLNILTTAFEDTTSKIYRAGVIPLIVNSAEVFVDNAKFKYSDKAFKLLSNLAAGGIDIVKSIKKSGELISVALRVIQGLGCDREEESVRTRISAMGLLEDILPHPSNSSERNVDVDRTGASGSECESNVSAEILSNNGIVIILQAMRQDVDGEALQAGCNILELLSYDNNGESNFKSAHHSTVVAAGGKSVLTLARNHENILEITKQWINRALAHFAELPLVPCCQRCFATPKKLLLCGRCGNAKYCSRVCQQADWKANHKQSCVKMKQSN